MRPVPHARALWLAHTLTVAFVIGVLAGLLSWAGGMNPPAAALAGAAAFSTSALLILSLIKFALAAPE
jgi:hypothetical protein